MKAAYTIFFILFTVFAIGVGGYTFYVNYQYERDIGAYFDNARDCINNNKHHTKNIIHSIPK